MDLSAENHIRVQAAIQQWVDSSISKTANCPADFTVEDTAELYELAFDLGCKGVTIYRDGSRDVQVLSTSKKEENKTEDQNTAEAEEMTVVSTIENPNNAEVQASDGTSNSQVGVRTHSSEQPPSSSTVLDKQYRSRPQVLRGATYKINTPFGMAYITINDLEGTPGEIFLNVGKAGSDVFAMAEALGRVCSLFLRYGDHGHKVELLIKHLKGIGGSGAIGFGANRVESIADAVAKALESHVQSAYPKVEDQETFTESRDLCPSCGSASLMNVEGCKTCRNCGYSKCN